MILPLVFLATLARCSSLAARAKVVDSKEAAQTLYDYVIVGAGTAGLTVADRLSEDGKHKVLVIEIGGFYDADGAQGPECIFPVDSAPQTQLGNRRIATFQGNCVGGSSAINGAALMRGTPRDYDIWAELGGKGSLEWTWKKLFPYFERAIRLQEPDPSYISQFNLTYDPGVWGQFENTRIYASFSRTLRPLYKVGYNALRKVPGLAFPRDGNGGTHGVFYYPMSWNQDTDTRSYSRTGHWDGITRSNYHLVTFSRVNKINLSGKRAVSVEFAHANGTSPVTIVRTKREIILSAGALRTPQVLQLSGIGPKNLLQAAGIPVKVDLPGVGANFQDHPVGPAMIFNWTQPPLPPSPGPNFLHDQGLTAQMSLPFLSSSAFRSISAKYSSQDVSLYLPSGTHPTIIAGQRAVQRIFSREMLSTDITFLNYIVSGAPSAQPVGFRIISRGTVLINTTSPQSAPIVDYRALSNPIDVDLYVAYYRWLRWHFNTNYAEYNATEFTPGAAVTSDEALGAWVRSDGYSPQGFHPVGTAAKMKREYGGVVDDELVVYGTENLRVVDASIMPTLIAGTTSQTVYAIAEKAAALIKRKKK